MAAIQKEPSGKWRARVRVNSVSESKTFATKAQASAWAAQKEQEAQEFGASIPHRTVKQAFDRYAEDVSPKKRAGDWERVRLAWLAESIGPDLLLETLKTPHFVEWRDRRLKEVKGATVRRDMTLLRSVFTTCVGEWQWLRSSPLKGCKVPADSEHRTRRVMPDEETRIRIATGTDEDRPARMFMHQVGIGFQFAIETAMRVGELLSLTTDCVDFDRQTAFLPMTKNGSARTVPLSARASALLKMLTPGEDGRFFTVSPTSFDALFRKAKDMACVEGLHFHDTRREATSRLSKKVDVLTLAKITGHKDLNMLMVYYDEDMSEVAKRI